MSDRTHRAIYTDILEDDDYQDGLGKDGKIVFVTLKLLLGKYGIAKLTKRTLRAKSNLHDDDVETGLTDLKEIGWVRYGDGVFWLVKGLKNEPSSSMRWGDPKHVKALKNYYDTLPNSEICTEFRQMYIDAPDSGGDSDADSPQSHPTDPDPDCITEPEPETETEGKRPACFLELSLSDGSTEEISDEYAEMLQVVFPTLPVKELLTDAAEYAERRGGILPHRSQKFLRDWVKREDAYRKESGVVRSINPVCRVDGCGTTRTESLKLYNGWTDGKCDLHWRQGVN